MRRRARLVPVLFVSFALAACGQGDATAPTDPAATSGTATPAPTTPAASTADTPDAVATTGSGAPDDDGAPDEGAVTIADFAFMPEAIEVAAGTTVTWTNEDSTAHTATVVDDGPDTGSISGGASASLTFESPGTYDYACAFHPGSMTGTVVVR